MDCQSKLIIEVITSHRVTYNPSFTNIAQNIFIISPSLTPFINASHTKSPKLVHSEISSAIIFSLAQTNSLAGPLKVLTHQIKQPQDGVKD